MELLVQVALVSLVVLLGWIWWKRSGDEGCTIPGPNALQAYTSFQIELGKTHSYMGLEKMGKKYGGFFAFRLFGKTFYTINDWKIMKDALVGQSDVFSGRPEMYVGTQMFAGTDILFIDGPQMKEKRRFVTHHLRNFGFGRVTCMESIILNQMSQLMDRMEGKCADSSKLVINGLFFLPVLNILFGLIAGKQYDYGDVKIQELEKTLKDVFVASHNCVGLNFFPWLKILPFYADNLRTTLVKYGQVKTFLNEEIDSHLKSMDGNAEPRDLMDAYLIEMQRRQLVKRTQPETTSDNSYSRDHLVGITFDILQAGLETTSATLEWTLLYMAQWPEIQRTVQDELDRVVGSSRLPTHGDHALMPYLEATILEIHRYTTVIPMSGPHSTMTATKVGGFAIPRRAIVLQNIWAVHHDPNLWADPEVFRPERFFNSDGKVVKPEYLIPFSLGGRKCIGEPLARIELFLMIACLLQRFTFRYATGEAPPEMIAKPLQIRVLEAFSLNVSVRVHT